MSTQQKPQLKIKEMTSEQMREKANEIEAGLEALRLHPLIQKENRKVIRHLRYQADFRDSGGLNRAQQKAKAAGLPIPASGQKRKAKVPKAVKTTTSVAAQGLLPGFTSVVTPRVDEMARDLVFRALQESVARELNRVSEVLKLKKA